MSLGTHQLVNQTSGIVEYYTPTFIVEAAREVMGGIDLDPFSSEAANKRVRASRIFTVEDDGFAQDWNCQRLWMNHPFGRLYNKRAIDRLMKAWSGGEPSGHIAYAAICITFAATSEAWFQPLMAHPQCFLCPRTNYHLPDGSVLRGVTKGSVVTYLGHNPQKFANVFRAFGAIKITA